LEARHPWLSIIEPRSHPTSRFRALANSLGLDRGEVSALLLCQDLENALLLSDDSAARLAAEALGFAVHGTLGILLRSMRRGLRSKPQVLLMLRSVPRSSTLHVRPALLEEIIRKADEYRGT
jgi:predicted nucleic acid-binding protein